MGAPGIVRIGPASVRQAPSVEERLATDIDLARATGFCARRFKPEFYPA